MESAGQSHALRLGYSIKNLPLQIQVVSEDPDAAAVAGLLEDDTARRILLETRTQPMSAETLSDRCGVSPSTVYRRIEDLREHDLIESQTRLEEDGHHYEVFSATLEQIVINATDDGFDVKVTREESMADRFSRLVEEM